ncbi:hypothetical protein KBI23_24455 [bacterium]|nr:hypothetical protein [bacterium]MBP9807869.1 hypothetical protein [bacterium]
MFANKSFVQTALIASSISVLSCAQPAWSNQWTDMFRTLLIPQTGVASTDSIAARDTQITNRIIDAINANKLSTLDTQNLKSQLDRIKSLESGYRANRAGGQLDAIETATLNAELNKVETSLNSMLGLSSSTTSNILGTTYGASITTNVDNFDASLADLKQRITKNLTTGRLTIDEARSLTNQYNRVLSDRNNFKADGSLTLDETNRLNQSLDELKRNITANNRDTQAWPGIDGQQAAQAKRIDDGIAAGKVSRTEYEQLKAESNRIANQETLARTNGLQLEETLALATSLRDLDRRISTSLNTNIGSSNFGGWPNDRDRMGDRDGRDFDMRQSYVLKRIDEGSASGRLDLAEATDLRADYTRLEQLEASFRADGRLTSNELSLLQQGLESIISELKEKSASVAVQYPEIDTKQTELKAKIDQGVASGRIKRFDGQRLSASLSWIATVEAALRQSGGSLDKTEADRVLADLNRLSAKIDRSASNPLQDLITRKNELQKKIDENSASGKLSYRSVRNLRRELDRIGYSLAAYSPTATLPAADITRLTADMDRLNTQITSGLTYGGDYRSGGRGDWNQR